jgi:3-isopropylmalate dehydratase small subunit
MAADRKTVKPEAVAKALEGGAWLFGDNLSTDHILPSRFMTQVKPHELAAHCLAGADPDFAAKVSPGDIVVAGLNCGYGSSREQAPQALKHSGVSAVVAASFARIFYRNCYNIGLPAIICPALAAAVQTGDVLRVDLTAGKAFNLTGGQEYDFVPPPAFLREYIRLGGLIPYLADQMGAPAGAGKEEK